MTIQERNPTVQEFLLGKTMYYVGIKNATMTATFEKGKGIIVTVNGKKSSEVADVKDEVGASRFYHHAKMTIPSDLSIPKWLEMSEAERAEWWRKHPPHVQEPRSLGKATPVPQPRVKRAVGKRDRFIKMLITDNPNKGEKSRAQFELLCKSRTVHGFIAQGGLPMWINHGLKNGWLSLHDNKQEN